MITSIRSCLFAGALLFVGAAIAAVPCVAQSSASIGCKVSSVNYSGWQSLEVKNSWVRLIIVPQLGGRLMQATFNGHDFLFVNPKYAGKEFPPSEDLSRWINYGGDKLWPMPEGTEDSSHWPGPYSGVLDAGEYTAEPRTDASQCGVHLSGPADPRTGIQYSREILLDAASPTIRFRATMRNPSSKPIRWSVQSVTQFDTSNSAKSGDYNRDFFAFTPVATAGAYPSGFHVRSGLADDPSYSVSDGWFRLHWLPLENEVWVDSRSNWIAVVDSSAGYGIVESFEYQAAQEYPGNASVIFYKNGSTLTIGEDGNPAIHPANPEASPRYMEAELNSPMVQLAPGEGYTMATEWHPVRATKSLSLVGSSGVLDGPAMAERSATGVRLSFRLGAFFPGTLLADVFGDASKLLSTHELARVNPASVASIEQDLPLAAGARSVQLRIVDPMGTDRGPVARLPISPARRGS